MRDSASTENEPDENKHLLTGLPMETAEERSRREQIEKKFERSQMKQLGLPEWKVLLTLAYNGPEHWYQMAQDLGVKYPVVHRATRSLENIGWVEIVDIRLSEKNVPTSFYNVTDEGVLWLFARVPKKVDPSLVDFSLNDSDGLRSTMETKDVSQVENLETRQDVYLHLLWYFNINYIAKHNWRLFPLIFEQWAYYRQIHVTGTLVYLFPETAFTTLVDYYRHHECTGATVGQIFTSKVYRRFLELYAATYASPSGYDFVKEETVQEAAQLFHSRPELQALLQDIGDEIEHRYAESLIFIKRVRTTANKLADRSTIDP
jgi:hypothetical protein